MTKVTVTDDGPKGGGHTSRRTPTLHTYVVTDDPRPPAPEEAPAPSLVAVRVIERKGKVALVEWIVGTDWRRAYIPAQELTPLGVAADVLAAGEPYGARWEELIAPATPQAIAQALRQQGIWTVSELAMRLGDAVQAANRVTLESLRRAIRAAKE